VPTHAFLRGEQPGVAEVAPFLFGDKTKT